MRGVSHPSMKGCSRKSSDPTINGLAINSSTTLNERLLPKEQRHWFYRLSRQVYHPLNERLLPKEQRRCAIPRACPRPLRPLNERLPPKEQRHRRTLRRGTQVPPSMKGCSQKSSDIALCAASKLSCNPQ